MNTSHKNYFATVKHPAKEGVARQYNGSICFHDNSYHYAWRREWNDGHSDLAAGTIHPETGIIDMYAEFTPPTGYWLEDPRLFVDGSGDLCILAALCNQTTWRVQQCLVCPYHLRGIRTLSPADAVEKNWTPFHGFDGFLYRPLNGTPLLRRDAGEEIPQDKRTIQYSGGTPALYIGRDRFLIIWHAFGHHDTRGRRYWFGAAVINREGMALEISARPLVIADDADPALVCPRTAKYNPSVVFPCGLAPYAGGYLVSAGIHDSADYLFHFRHGDLDLVPARMILDPGSCVREDDPIPAGMLAVVAQVPLFEGGFHRATGDRFLIPSERRECLGNLVK